MVKLKLISMRFIETVCEQLAGNKVVRRSFPLLRVYNLNEMKKNMKTFTILPIIIFAISCGQNSDSKHDHSKTEQIEEHDHGNENVLRLDNGNLWLANSETTTGINNMINLINSFSDKESIDACTKLKNSLETEFSLIFKNCTMTGEAHNQLHNYLLPMKEMFDEIGSSDLDNCKLNLEKLKKHLSNYSNYFR